MITRIEIFVNKLSTKDKISGDQMTTSNKKISINRILIFCNGDFKNLDFYRQLIKEDDFIICADGGANHALAIGAIPDIVVGDLDSINMEVLKQLKDCSTKFYKYPCEKDMSDLEIALEKAFELEPKEILLLGALGDRLDHSLGNIMLLTLATEKGIKAKIIDEFHEVFIIKDKLVLHGAIGEYLSLFPLTAEVKGVKTKGLKYPLKNETLYFASTRGLSNEFINEEAEVSIEQGYLLAIKVRTEKNK